MDKKKEKSFDVSITRIEYGSRTIRVDNVDTEKEAKEKALEVAGDYEFGSYDAEYEASGCSEVAA